MADLESALHYILRVEVGKFSMLEGHRLVALRKFMAVLAQVSRALVSLVHAAPCAWIVMHPCRHHANVEESAQALSPELVVQWDVWTHSCRSPPQDSAVSTVSIPALHGRGPPPTPPQPTLCRGWLRLGPRALGISPGDLVTVALPASVVHLSLSLEHGFSLPAVVTGKVGPMDATVKESWLF